ncbi:hypothetical protein L211DRAFT_842269 [Terfezia boudieri ATCC MYA-4762]|uniref:Uncharacterized protein n=1 Tax=Terfezia boudieri ATCC MYA-4762 TaxID=1051890 RepID=A0A3N4LB18_9PEZI|nr:hypothetical protein L211DRAFT_842269 [Terfezia boudieri ATCC MYA-4762]
MTSRRIVSTEKTVLDKDDMSSRGPPGPAPPDILPGSIPQISKSVISKLLAYTIAMIVAPLSAYYLTLNHIYNGNNTFAGATAAVVANIVLIAYVIEALREDDADNKEGKKNR